MATVNFKQVKLYSTLDSFNLIPLIISNKEIEESYFNRFNKEGNIITDQSFTSPVSFSTEELLNEEWKFIKNLHDEYRTLLQPNNRVLRLFNVKDYCISNLGRIAKYNSSLNSLELKKCMQDYKDGYKIFSLLHQPFFIHKLVLLLFSSLNLDIETKYICDHINNNRIDNRISNLRWVTIIENNNNRKSKTKDKARNTVSFNFNKIKLTNINTNTEFYFANTKEAANFFNVSIATITKCYRGLIEYIEKDGEQYICNTTNTFTKEWYPVIQLDLNTKKVLGVYLTIDDIKNKYSNININNLRRACLKNENEDSVKYTCGGFIWVFHKHYRDNFKTYEWYEDINLNLSIVQLSERFKIVKIYEDIYEAIADGFNINSIIKSCNLKSKTTYVKFHYAGKVLKRIWWYLKDILDLYGVSTIDQLEKSLWNTRITSTLKLTYNNRIISSSKNIEEDLISKTIPSLFKNITVRYDGDIKNYGYEIEYSEEDLENEEWRSLSLIDEKYKVYFPKDGIWYKLFITNSANPSLYYISNLGRVARYDRKSKRLLLKSIQVGKDNYRLTWLNTNNYSVHRLVAFLFINNPNPNLYWHINHKNNIRYDNRSSNLEWCDIDYNNKYKSKHMAV